MRVLLSLLASGIAATLSNTATAQQATNNGYVDGYYVADSSIGDGTDDVDGDGFGIRGMARVSQPVGLYAEYQSVGYDDFDVDLDQLRLGAAFLADAPGGSGLSVEYVKAEIESYEMDGFGIHGRLAGEVTPGLQFFGEIGYLLLEDDYEDMTGLEYQFGAVFAVNQQVSLLADYRVTDLEGEDSNEEVEIKDLRLGARFRF